MNSIAVESGMATASRLSEREEYGPILQSVADPVIAIDAEHRIVMWNSSAEEMFGYTPAQILGQPLDILIPASSRARHTDLVNSFAESEEKRRPMASGLPLWGLRQNGETFPCEVGIGTINTAEGRLFVATVRDVSSRVEAEEERNKASAWFHSLVQNAPDAIMVVDADGLITYVSPSFERVMGYPASEMVGEAWLGGVHSDHRQTCSEQFDEIVNLPGGQLADLTTQVRHRDGNWRWISAKATNLLHDGLVDGVILNFRDITDQKNLEEDLERHRLHDRLTGLPNRILLTDRIEHALRRSRRSGLPLGVILIDLDNFKSVNDGFGQSLGDMVLGRIAERLSSAVRDSDTLGRLDGDEFAILCDEIDEETSVTKVADRVAKVLEPAFEVMGTEVFLTASIGAVTTVDPDSRPDDLIGRADAAVRLAKERGRNRVEFYDETLSSSIQARLRLAAGLRNAMQNDELSLNYQPVIDLATGRVNGFEALARWTHPEWGAVSPVDFIPAAEDSGLIVELDCWVLDHACRQLAEWQQRYSRSLEMAVNVSARHLTGNALIETVAAVLQEYRLDPSLLCLELTETALVSDHHRAAELLQSFRDLGVGLAVDDFGTGYASLSYLSLLPVTHVKIDRSFTSGLGERSNDTAIVAATHSLAQNLDLKVVAEGVETPDQMQRLQEMGSDYLQGYYFSRPLTPEDADELLGNNPCWQVPETIDSDGRVRSSA